MFTRAKICAFAMFFLVCGLCIYARSDNVLGFGEAEARQMIDEARSAVVSGYVSVADADEAGANVTGLLVTLNNASDLLSRAEFAFGNSGVDGNYDVSYALASECQQLLNGFDAVALSLRNSAAQQRFSNFMIYVIGSILATVVVILGSYVLWVVLKKRIGQAGDVSDGS